MKVNLNELICELYMHKFVIFLALFHNFVPLYKGVKPLKFSFKKKKKPLKNVGFGSRP